MPLETLIWKLSWATFPLFWPIFCATLAAILWVGTRSRDPWWSGARQPLLVFDRSTLAILAVVLPLGAFITWGGDFAYHDNDVFTEFTVIGRPWRLGIWPNEGRYFPLFAQEFNVLGLIAATPFFYYLCVSAQLTLFSLLLLTALADLSAAWRVGIIAVVVLANSVAITFSDLIYTERNVVFWLSVLIVAVQRQDRARSRANWIVALIAAQVALYYKETTFLVIGTVALARLGIAWRNGEVSSLRTLPSRRLELGLLGVSAIFASQFLISMLAARSSQYLRGAQVSSLRAAWDYFRSDPLLVAFFVGIGLRVRQLRRSRELDPLWDPLGLAALVYFVALVLAGLSADRYVAPVDMLGALFGFRQIATARFEAPGEGIALRVGAASVMLAAITFGVTRILEYKSIIRGTSELAGFVEHYASRHPSDLRLYFPRSESWRILNFQAYLNYRKRAALDRIHFLAPREFKDGRCMYYLATYRCESASAPAPGDLILQLPDDRERIPVPRAVGLFEYELVPGGMPGILGLFLHREEPLFAGRRMPPGWLAATVTIIPSNAPSARRAP